MPNHVANVIRIDGIKNLPLFSTDEDGIQYFDFNKVIPMPESLNIDSGSIENIAIEAVMMKLSKREQYSFNKKNYCQMTDDEFKQRNHGKSEDELEKIGLRYISNLVMYGATTWYDWRCKHWGTKWNAYDFEFKDDNTIMFQTAWSCPEPIVEKIAEMYPDLTIEHWWADEDCGNNSGYMLYENENVYGDYDEQGSSDAYEHYDFCWGGSNCIYQDDEGNYHKHDCDTCTGCN